MSHFADLCHRLCMKILELFAMGLKVCCRTPTGWRYLPLTKISLVRSQRGRQGVVLLPTRSLRGTFRHDPKIPARKGSDPERSIPPRYCFLSDPSLVPIPARGQRLRSRDRRSRGSALRLWHHHASLPAAVAARSRDPHIQLDLATRPRHSAGHGERPDAAHLGQRRRSPILLDEWFTEVGGAPGDCPTERQRRTPGSVQHRVLPTSGGRNPISPDSEQNGQDESWRRWTRWDKRGTGVNGGRAFARQVGRYVWLGQARRTRVEIGVDHQRGRSAGLDRVPGSAPLRAGLDGVR